MHCVCICRYSMRSVKNVVCYTLHWYVRHAKRLELRPDMTSPTSENGRRLYSATDKTPRSVSRRCLTNVAAVATGMRRKLNLLAVFGSCSRECAEFLGTGCAWIARGPSTNGCPSLVPLGLPSEVFLRQLCPLPCLLLFS